MPFLGNTLDVHPLMQLKEQTLCVMLPKCEARGGLSGRSTFD